MMSGVKPELVLFPGESEKTVPGVNPGDPPRVVTLGRMYVLHGGGESWECAGAGPAGSKGSIPKGVYILAGEEQHISRIWPMSVIPWGAPLRIEGGVVQYLAGGKWHDATGRVGQVTSTQMLCDQRAGKRSKTDDIEEMYWDIFVSLDGELNHDTWLFNDFGPRAWNLTHNGQHTDHFIHTTPENEAATAAGEEAILVNAPGGIHLRPADRDDMMSKGYLVKGMKVSVKDYGKKGPPA